MLGSSIGLNFEVMIYHLPIYQYVKLLIHCRSILNFTCPPLIDLMWQVSFQRFHLHPNKRFHLHERVWDVPLGYILHRVNCLISTPDLDDDYQTSWQSVICKELILRFEYLINKSIFWLYKEEIHICLWIKYLQISD